jgi:hypothetical protein
MKKIGNRPITEADTDFSGWKKSFSFLFFFFVRAQKKS